MVNILSDQYRLQKNKIDSRNKMLRGMGIDEEVNPVDMNGGFVAFDKNDPENLNRTQDNLNWRFSARGIHASSSDEVDPVHDTTVIYPGGKTRKMSANSEGGEGE